MVGGEHDDVAVLADRGVELPEEHFELAVQLQQVVMRQALFSEFI
jgi:hypothetical protein